MARLSVARALTAYVMARILKVATFAAAAVFLVMFAVTCALVYFFSPWWWLLMVPFVILLCVFLLFRFFVCLAIGRIHRERMTKEQRTALSQFVDKIQGLLEARATPLPIFALICIKDLVLHRDITTIKKLIKDSTGLRSEYMELEKLF